MSERPRPYCVGASAQAVVTGLFDWRAVGTNLEKAGWETGDGLYWWRHRTTIRIHTDHIILKVVCDGAAHSPWDWKSELDRFVDYFISDLAVECGEGQ